MSNEFVSNILKPKNYITLKITVGQYPVLGQKVISNAYKYHFILSPSLKGLTEKEQHSTATDNLLKQIIKLVNMIIE